MRAALHVLATIVVLPYVALASAFAILGHSISSGSLLSLFDTLLAHAVWIVPWGLIAFACAMIVVAVLGMIPRFRWLGAVCLFFIAGASLAVIFIGNRSRVDSPQLLFLLPCALVLIVSAWLAVVPRQSGPAKNRVA
jgi:hypothetical protein